MARGEVSAAQAPAALALRSTQPEPDWHGAGTVLVVDDDAQARAIVQRLLERLGFEVLEAGDGIEALELLDARAPDLACVLLDLTIPRMDGHECLAHLRERAPALPVLVCSGYSERALDPSLQPSGFIAKPYAFEALRERLQALLG